MATDHNDDDGISDDNDADNAFYRKNIFSALPLKLPFQKAS